MQRCGQAQRNEHLEAQLEKKKKRLAAYEKREEIMLSPDGIKSYGVGSRNIQRYDTALSAIQDMISTLEKEIAELERQLCGRSARGAIGVVPRDW